MRRKFDIFQKNGRQAPIFCSLVIETLPTDTFDMCISQLLHLSYENIDRRRNFIFFRKMDSRPPFCSNVIKILICIVCLAVELQLAL